MIKKIIKYPTLAAMKKYIMYTASTIDDEGRSVSEASEFDRFKQTFY